MMNLKEFGQTLHKLRKRAGITQESLANELHVSADLISKWERAYEYKGRHWIPDRDSVVRLIEIFASHLERAKAQSWAAQAGYTLDETELQKIISLQPVQKPMQIPPLPALHIRRDIIEQLIFEQFYSLQNHTLVLLGPGGAGKTTLATWIAQALAADFPDGVIWVEMTPHDGVAQAQDWVARSLGVVLSENTLPGRAGELRSILHKKQCLIILDDVWTTLALRHLQLGSETTRLLVTTRDAKVANVLDAPFFRVPGMTHYEGQALLEAWVGHNLEDRYSRKLVTRLEGLPLALRLSGAQLRSGVSLADLLATLQLRQADLSIFDMDEPQSRDESLTLCFDLSYNTLSPGLQQRFEQLSLFAGVLDEEAIAALWQVERSEARRSLRRLHRLGLLERSGLGYRLHPLLRAYAWQRLNAHPRRTHLAGQRYTAWYIRHVLYHPRVLDGVTEPAPNLDVAWADVVAAVKWASTCEPQLAVQATWLAHTERPALFREVGPALITAVTNYLPQIDNETERAFIFELLGGLYLLNNQFEKGIASFNQADRSWGRLENWLLSSQARLRVAGIHLLNKKQAEAAAVARQAQTRLEEGLAQISENPDVIRWLFYWFNMVYNPLVRWTELPEEDVANLARLAAKTNQPLLKARGLHIYRLWCTAEAFRPPAAREKGRQLALQAYKLWRACGRMDRADDEVSWANYRLTGRYSQRAAARYARRRSQSTPVIGQSQVHLLKSEGIRWWLNATCAQRVGWLSRMLPRYLQAANASAPALSAPSRARRWIDDILNISILGSQGRRLSLVKPPPPGHFLHDSEWYVLSGQKVLPLAGKAAARQLERYLTALERRYRDI